jgi:hypothetical protein
VSEAPFSRTGAIRVEDYYEDRPTVGARDFEELVIVNDPFNRRVASKPQMHLLNDPARAFVAEWLVTSEPHMNLRGSVAVRRS